MVVEDFSLNPNCRSEVLNASDCLSIMMISRSLDKPVPMVSDL